eukprot:302589-Chlamydomonas_euryale.AAC.2
MCVACFPLRPHGTHAATSMCSPTCWRAGVQAGVQAWMGAPADGLGRTPEPITQRLKNKQATNRLPSGPAPNDRILQTNEPKKTKAEPTDQRLQASSGR